MSQAKAELRPRKRVSGAHATRVLEALGGLARGEIHLAAALLVDHALRGDERAREALSEAVAGRWKRGMDLLAVIAEEPEPELHLSIAEWDRQIAEQYRRELLRRTVAKDDEAAKLSLMVPREMLEKSGFNGRELDAAEGQGLGLEEAVDRGVVKLPAYLTRELLAQYLKNLETVDKLGMSLEEWTEALGEVVCQGSAADIERFLDGDEP